MIVWLLFTLALGYVGKLLYKSFFSKNKGCPKGCSSCALDINKLEEQLKKQESLKQVPHSHNLE